MSDQQTRLFEPSGAEKTSAVECLGMTFESEEARRAYFIERLREKLQDPEFRKTPGFPKGSDKDILRLSDPPYYTACPNPFLNLALRGRTDLTIEGTDDGLVPFASDVSEGKNDPIYNAHSYHTKVPHRAIVRYLMHYTRPGDVVLDPFCGSGMTGVAVAVCATTDRALRHELDPEGRGEWGQRTAVLSDLSPVASLIAHNYSAKFDAAFEQRRAQALLNSLEQHLGWAFRTRHTGWPSSDRTSDDRRNRTVSSSTYGTINFVLWSDVFSCPQCSAAIVYWNEAADPENASIKDSFQCPSCRRDCSKRDLDRVTATEMDPELGAPHTSRKQVPVLINYSAGGQRFEKFPDDEDLEILRRVSGIKISGVSPTNSFMFKGERWGDTWRAGYHFGFTHSHHFYSRRNLAALSFVWTEALESRSPFLQFLFTSTHAWATRLNRLLVSNYFKKRGGVIGQTLSGTMYVSSVAIETNAIERFRLRLESIGHTAQSNSVFVGTQSATSLKNIEDGTIDYVFVDPPFGDNLYYAELNHLWESWLQLFSEVGSEAVVSPSQGKALPEYLELMARAFAEMYRVLRPGKWLTVVFHNSKNAVWNAIQEAILRAGFVVADVRVLEKTHKTYKQLTSKNAVRQDLAISAYKPTAVVTSRIGLSVGSPEGVWAFVAEHLSRVPVVVREAGTIELVAERQRHLLFDRMVALHVQKGASIPISAAEFYAGLEQKFPQRDGMYFLPAQIAEFDRERRSAGELRQLELFVTDEASAILWLRQQLTRKPQSFADLQPVFMRELQSWAKHEQTIELREILEQNFLVFTGNQPVPSQIHSYLSTNFKDLRAKSKEDPALVEKAKDRWYVPDPNKQSDLERLRERTLLREFEEYKTSKQRRLKELRTEAVRAGFKACYDAGDYQTILSVAAKIPDTVLEEDEKLLMYYDVASMRLGNE